MVPAAFSPERYHRLMRRLIKLGLILLGIRLFLRWWKQRHGEDDPWTVSSSATDPADELRRTLAESRTEAVDDAPAATPEASVADRRAEVHEQGRAALDEMKTSDES